MPPHLRGVQPSQNQNSEVDIRLTKQLKGLLNRQGLVDIYQPLLLICDHVRMSEQNLETILDGVEEAYRAYRRHGTCSCSLVL